MTRWAATAIAVVTAGLASTSAACRSTGDRGAPGDPVEGITPLSQRADARTDEEPGFTAVLTSKDLADVPAPYTSASVRLRVKLGDTVTRGQIVARLDDTQLRQELAAAQAQLRTARAEINRAVVAERGAQIVLEREQKAEAAGVASRADVAAASQAVANALAAIAIARAAADERSARIAQLQAHLQEMTLVAPIAGSVATVYPQDGARIEEGRPVMRIISGGVFVKFAIPADKAGTVKPGDPVDVRLDRRTEPLTARVGHVSPELDAVAQMIIADADLVDPPADLQPGTVGVILPRPPRAK